jgi:hypothetical protein
LTVRLGRPVLPERRQRGVQFAARTDAELDKYLPQVPFDRARGQEQLGADLRVGAAVARQRAICSSCGVSWSRVSPLRLRTVSPVAVSSRRARSANASIPIEVN